MTSEQDEVAKVALAPTVTEDDLGLTRERVRQIQIEALMTLRKMIRRSGNTQDALL